MSDADCKGAGVADHFGIGGVGVSLACVAGWGQTHYCVGVGDKEESFVTARAISLARPQI